MDPARGRDLRHPLIFRDYFFLAGLPKKSLQQRVFLMAAQSAASAGIVFLPRLFYAEKCDCFDENF